MACYNLLETPLAPVALVCFCLTCATVYVSVDREALSLLPKCCCGGSARPLKKSGGALGITPSSHKAMSIKSTRSYNIVPRAYPLSHRHSNLTPYHLVLTPIVSTYYSQVSHQPRSLLSRNNLHTHAQSHHDQLRNPERAMGSGMRQKGRS